MCPATDTGKVLNPMELIAEGKRNLFANGMEILRARSFDSLGAASNGTPMSVSLIGDGESSVKTDSIWECTTCGACTEKCPVFIEQFPKILKMRRHLVMFEDGLKDEKADDRVQVYDVSELLAKGLQPTKP
jgi:Fe-S oxidoreductase